MATFIATAIKMKSNCAYSNSLLEIDKIYLGNSEDGWYSKESIHDYVTSNPGSVVVGNNYGPRVIPCVSSNREKYVRSLPNNTENDNLLNLPRK